MNSYFKTAEEITSLFQKAFEALEQQGYDAAVVLFEVAFRHDPYRLQAHYKLAIHFASINDVPRFKEHFFICRNIDPAYNEKISTDAIVVHAFGKTLITEMLVTTEPYNTWCRREFKSIEPLDSNTWLIFKPDQKRGIADVYTTFDEVTRRYFIKRKRNGEPPTLYEEYGEPDFDQLDYFQLEHASERGGIDCAPEKLYTALQRLSVYINDLRFFVISEWDDFVDEVIILNGAFHIYRHATGAETWYGKLEYFETIVESYPEEAKLRSWLCLEYQNDVLFGIHYDAHGDPAQYLDNAIRLSTPEDPWMSYVLGKVALHKGDRETALKYFKEAATKTSDVFEIYKELGELQLFHTAKTRESALLRTQEYRESAQHLSIALGIKKYTDIYLHRALAYHRIGEMKKVYIDLDHYIYHVKPYNNAMLVNGGWLFSDAGFDGIANYLFEAALEKIRLYEEELTEKINTASTDSNREFYKKELAGTIRKKLRAYVGLTVNAESPEAEEEYAFEVLVLAEKDARELFNLGVAFQDKKKMAEAEKYYDLSIAQDPHYMKALNNKSIIRLQQKDYTAVLKLTEQMKEIDPDYAETYITIANACFYLKDLPSALEAYEKYIVLKPASETGHFGVGFIYAHLRQDEKAIPYLLKGIELSTNNAQANEMYSNLASCYNNTGRLAEGMDAAERSIAINPHYYYPYYVLACILNKEGRDEEALEMVKKALSLAPSQRDQIINEPDLAGLKERMISL